MKHEQSEAGSSRYLSFSLGEEKYTIPLLVVQEVIAIPSITPLPDAPPYFLGIMNLRGRVISIVDLKAKLKTKGGGESPGETAVIILDLGNALSLGIRVDSVNSVLTLNHSQLSPCPELGDGSKADYLSGIARTNDCMYLMLEVEKVFQNDKARAASAEAAAA